MTRLGERTWTELCAATGNDIDPDGVDTASRDAAGRDAAGRDTAGPDTDTDRDTAGRDTDTNRDTAGRDTDTNRDTAGRDTGMATDRDTATDTGMATGGGATCGAVSSVALAPILALPIGSCEQHGPHLPLDTDTRIAVALADRLAATVDGVLVAPPLTVTASGEHSGFPGTLSIGTEATTLVLVELVRSADWSRGVVFVNGHGGNAAAVRAAMRTLVAEGRHVVAWWPRLAGADAHAGRTETSLMLAVAPDLVRLDSAESGNTGSLAELSAALTAAGVASVSPNGVLGDPAGASAEEGLALLDVLTADLVECVRAAWR